MTWWGDFMSQLVINQMTSPLKAKPNMLYEASISVGKDSEFYASKSCSVDVDIFEHAPLLIDITTPDGGASLSVAETRQLIEALQKAIELIEAK